jgi:Zinc finger, C3HC4 type (RING finger)
MDPGGCLYVEEQSDISEHDLDDTVWETDSEDGDYEEPSFISRLAAEIRADAAVALEDGVRQLLAMDFDAESEPESEPEQEQEKAPLFEAPIPLGECPICYEELKMIDFTVTKCGHTFHSSCVFRAMEQNVDCPMCRCQLLEVQEDEDQEDQDQEEDDEDQEEDDDEEEEDEPKVTLEQLYAKLQNMGYTALDILSYVVESGGLKRQDETRNTAEFLDVLGDKIWGVAIGDISLAHVDQRTYAQVAAGPPQTVVQLKDLERRLLANRNQPQPQEA